MSIDYEKRKKTNRIILMIFGIFMLMVGVLLIFFGDGETGTFIYGSIFSIIGIALINASVKEKNSKTPEEILNDDLEKNNIKATKMINLGLLKNTLIIDDEKDMFIIAIIEKGKRKYKKFKYNQLIDFELIEDEEIKVKSNALKTVAGGVTFGIVGALVGATSNKKKKEYCNNMEIRINLDDLNNSITKINIINKKTKVNSIKYKELQEKTEELLGVLKYIENNNNKK